jgi:diguanylate cyclase (GGDEF)-like protein
MDPSTILVVDDELFFRRLYADFLCEHGYQVEAVPSGEDALARLLQGDIDVVVTDLIMPGMDGLELLNHARKLDNPAEIILVTGHATVESAIQALKNGARDYLVKPFDPEELLHLVRVCLEQRHLLNENSLLKSQIQLYRKGQHLASQLDLDQLFAEALDALLWETQGGRGLACLVAEGELNQLIAFRGLLESDAMALIDSVRNCLAGPSELRFVRRDDAATDIDLPEGVHTVGIFPLQSPCELAGAMIICNPAEGDFTTPLPRDNLVFLLEQTILGFGNACRFKNARDLIFIDDLTGLHNYRYLQTVLDQEILRAERYDLEFSLVFVDLDYFKKINDSRGHLAGSQALKETADLMKTSVRDSDILFRYGGDEFTGFLVETGPEGAAVVAERIRQSIEQHVFLADSSRPARLTATVGYATFPTNAGNKHEIIHLADQAMYAGKKKRNVVQGAWALLGQEGNDS